jgi:NAD+ diphosphatase
LSRYEIDRDYLARSRPALFDELWADPATRLLVLWRDNALLAPPVRDSLALLPVSAVREFALRLFLGRSLAVRSPEPVGTPIVAVQVTDEVAAALGSDPGAWGSLRTVGSTLSDRDAGLLTEALALANWHRSHAFSPRDGLPLEPAHGGWILQSTDEATPVFPRTDPAIIVAVVDAQDRLLLGSNALWEANRYSLLAGFVEPGEALEAAVAREVFEESGVRVVDPVYFGSQPWPFPASLMVGFFASADSAADPTPDGDEILDVRWFDRDELRAAGSEVVLPGPTSIARVMIEEWFGGPIGTR